MCVCVCVYSAGSILSTNVLNFIYSSLSCSCHTYKDISPQASKFQSPFPGFDRMAGMSVAKTGNPLLEPYHTMGYDPLIESQLASKK